MEGKKMKNIYTDDIMEQRELDWIDELENLTDTLDNVKKELNRKLALANKYGYAEYADELYILLEKLDTLRKMYR